MLNLAAAYPLTAIAVATDPITTWPNPASMLAYFGWVALATVMMLR
jgi:hypothetical protein